MSPASHVTLVLEDDGKTETEVEETMSETKWADRGWAAYYEQLSEASRLEAAASEATARAYLMDPSKSPEARRMHAETYRGFAKSYRESAATYARLAQEHLDASPGTASSADLNPGAQ